MSKSRASSSVILTELKQTINILVHVDCRHLTAFSSPSRLPLQSRDQSSGTILIKLLWQHDSRYRLGSADLGEFGRKETEADYPSTDKDRQTSELGSHKVVQWPLDISP